MMPALRLSLIPVVLFALSACDGGGGGLQVGEPNDSKVQLSITDAPVDNAEEVVVKIDRVSFKPQDSGEIDFPISPATQINLLEFTDGQAVVLLPPSDLPPGPYEWVRLSIVDDNADPSNYDSFVRLRNGGIEPITVPSGTLRLNRGFTVPEDGLIALTVDFDLRKALVDPVGKPGYHLKPVMRVVRDSEVGLISGSVPSGWLTRPECTGSPGEIPASDEQPATAFGNAVYVYPEHGVTPDDVGSSGSTPLVSAPLRRLTDGSYRYTVAYLPAGNYTLAFTCQASEDDPESDESDQVVSFPVQIETTATAGTTTTANFPEPTAP